MPPAVVTMTETLPAPAPAGTVTLSVPSSTTVGVAVLEPKLTELAVDRFMPVIVTVLPPASGPTVGEPETTIGPGRK